MKRKRTKRSAVDEWGATGGYLQIRIATELVIKSRQAPYNGDSAELGRAYEDSRPRPTRSCPWEQAVSEPVQELWIVECAEDNSIMSWHAKKRDAVLSARYRDERPYMNDGDHRVVRFVRASEETP